MGREAANKWGRARFARWAIVYALGILYCSVMVGPSGFHFVPLEFGHAWRQFLATPYLVNGSDQRADWVANMLMFVPMGFLVCGIFYVPRHAVLCAASCVLAFGLCVLILLSIKFAQLFFPGRTVSINYIVAQ